MTAPDVRAERSIVEPINDLELIEHLDFEHTPQCEHSQHGKCLLGRHGGPAYVLVRVSCGGCDLVHDMYVCRDYWAAIIAGFPCRCACGFVESSHTTYTPLGWVE